MNFGTPVPLLLGIILIIGAVVLFFLDKLRPGYERDYDKVYAVLCLLSGIFLLTQLTMELIPAFQQIVMVGMLIALMIQNIRSRAPGAQRFAQQPDMGMPPPRDNPRDSYRPTRGGRPPYRPEGRQSVRAELERRDLGPSDRGGYRPSRPMLGGRPEPSADPPAYYGDSEPGYGRGSDYGRSSGYGSDPAGYSANADGGYSANADPGYSANADGGYSANANGGYSANADGGYDRPDYSDDYSNPPEGGDAYSSSRYGGPRRPNDERIRTRRPLRLRDGSDRYRRLKPGDPTGRRGL
ncbi:hypothetical protein C7271_08325 [filamentous cyanobacterium CCP5]|nr:hypothetical protein C7271_08325 [filamentous cyanobacterium CCP5]